MLCEKCVGMKRPLNERNDIFIDEEESIVNTGNCSETTADGADVRLHGMLHSARFSAESLVTIKLI